MRLYETDLALSSGPDRIDWFSHVEKALRFRLQDGGIPIRFAVTASSPDSLDCEIGLLEPASEYRTPEIKSIFEFRKRAAENLDRFCTVLLVPTGIGAEIGGHAGDATPVARLLSEASDVLVTHPNVVNASDINEMPENALYVEGSVICRMLMGAVGLQRVRSNRVLTVIHAHEDSLFANAAVNSVNAARASYGLTCPRVIEMDPPLVMRSGYTSSGRAAGEVLGLENLLGILETHRDEYDAVAVSSVIDVPKSFHQDYFRRAGEMVNPWGGVEAMLTHAISSILDVPSAHSPMFESRDIANMDSGVVDARMAAEAISTTFLQCILKGLQRSPQIVTDPACFGNAGIVSASDVSCLVIPDGCLGLPTLAALYQGIPVIAVRENANLMRNDLQMLPWRAGQLHIVENYWEAVGVMNAVKAGIDPMSVRRPFGLTTVEAPAADTAVADDDATKVDRRAT